MRTAPRRWRSALFAALIAALASGAICAPRLSLPVSEQGEAISAIRERGVLRVGLRQDLPRFAYLEPRTNRWHGFEVALAREIAAALLGDPAKLELVRVAAAQPLAPLQDGSADLVIAQLSRDLSREIAVSSPYFVSGIGYLVPRGRAAVPIEELSRTPVCAVARSGAAEALRARIPEARTVLVDTGTECLAALAGGSAGAMVGEIPLLVRLALEDPATAIGADLLEEHPLVVGAARHQPDLLRAVDELLAALRRSSRWTALHRYYFDGLLPPRQPPA
ncbi:MAG: transporter substrate-binding domain-containing protein [Chloroflexota bacterium]|nr:transporter substrate-binding domain-containing protein [Dehalococcoidia bacterium]MDW8252909.1 transporter substrate-binding domain-containing protein [Chloroflexota bacterium]